MPCASGSSSTSSLTGSIAVVAQAKKDGVKMVDYKFLDFVGIWQHFTTPISEFGEDTFEEGIGFDGSSIRGFQSIENSDMVLLADPDTAIIDPDKCMGCGICVPTCPAEAIVYEEVRQKEFIPG